MSRYHRVRPQAKPAEAKETAETKQPTAEERYRKTIEDAAEALYIEHNGDTLEASIKRAEKTLAVYDHDLERVTAGEESFRWNITPSMAVRWQHELEKLQARREAVRAECWQLARQLVDDWMAAKNEAPPEGTHSPRQVHFAIDEDAPGARVEEGGPADADRKA